MNRYFSSFLITSFLYVGLISTYLYSLDTTKTVKQDTKKEEQKVRFCIITQQKKIKKIKQIKPKTKIKKPKKTVVKKIKPKKKKIKKIQKPKPKKVKPIVKKIEPKIKEINEPIVEKIEKVEKTPREEPIKREVQQNIPVVQKIDTKEIERKNLLKEQYFNNIKNKISKNKSYPRKAVRRGIQGDVKVEFIISPTGELISFKILEGKRVFNKSIQKAINRSFPFLPPQDVFTSNITLTLTVRYTLH